MSAFIKISGSGLWTCHHGQKDFNTTSFKTTPPEKKKKKPTPPGSIKKKHLYFFGMM